MNEKENENLEENLNQDTSLSVNEEPVEKVNEPLSPDFLHNILITNDDRELQKTFEENSAVTLADSLNLIGDDEIVLFYSSLHSDYDKLGEIFSYLYTEEKLLLCKKLSKKQLAPVLANVSNDDMADFLEDIPKAQRNQILQMLPGKRRTLIDNLARYSDDTAGSIMTTEFLSVLSGTRVKDIFQKIKQIGARLETVRTLFIVDNLNHLLGTEDLEDLMFVDENERIDNVMQKDFAYISPIADKEQAVPICEEYDLPVLPVVSKNGEMLGIITFDDVMDVLEEENTEDILKQSAVSPNKTPYMESSSFAIARSYVVWLIILLIINTFTGIIVSRFENALLTLPILISFIPALNDTTGNSGSQTTSMVIRALTAENVQKKDYGKIIGKEALTGFFTGLFIALFNFAWVMMELNTPLLNVTEEMKDTLLNDLKLSNLQFGYMIIAGIVSLALFVGVFFSKLFASILPLLAKAVHMDPAVMSGPLISSIMDILTLLLYFGTAVLVIDSIAPHVLQM